ncbi:endonuclease III [Encephalitozoon intestinalis ATCC 50506]|uniref:Endonuclease III homolog n=1 Tax=Encephalitozoon intestinalis (strain ATCC 50506) TaxID=876142 RepID=E0S8M3_ENCIT|nr:endonuclease III [Encephalitozoon intestinalis ATCC 50506]ADM12017.1 endonuclease III [Encephalitozoon intestinalis ATCC 50506]UTX45805.1 endonuclease III [Encephalitozoon intestinalis]
MKDTSSKERKKESLELYLEIKKQRENIVSPVDTMGCFVTPSYKTEEERRFHILVSLLLSSQTKDEITYEAMERLRTLLPEGGAADGRDCGLTMENVTSSSVGYIDSCIKRVGFHTKKAENLKRITEILREKGLPEEMKDLVSLPGIGNKMAILYMNHACGSVVGISVDTHVHRISNRIGLVKTKDAESTRRELEKIVPKREWETINRVLVGYGQTVCVARRPKCEECCIRSKCPSSFF